MARQSLLWTTVPNGLGGWAGTLVLSGGRSGGGPAASRIRGSRA